MAGWGLQMTGSNTQDLLNTARGEFGGEKPVVALHNNMQSALTYYVRGKFPWRRNLKLADSSVILVRQNENITNIEFNVIQNLTTTKAIQRGNTCLTSCRTLSALRIVFCRQQVIGRLYEDNFSGSNRHYFRSHVVVVVVVERY